MEILICATNLAVPACVSMAKERTGQNIMLITDQPNIDQFFRFIDLPNVKIIRQESDYSSLDILGVLKAKRRIRNLLMSEKVEKVHYFHQAFGGFLNWIISYCHDEYKAKVEFHRVLRNLQYPKANLSLRLLGMLVKQRLFFGHAPSVQSNGKGMLFPKISEKFAKDNEVKEVIYTPNKSLLMNTTLTLQKKLGIEIDDNVVVLLTGSSVASGIVEEHEYSQKINELISAIGGDRIICKCHPRYNDENEAERRLAHIPSFVPMEFLIHCFHYYIGTHSTILKFAAENGSIAISLMEYITPTDQSQRDRFHDYFKGTDVLFPQTLQEIINILNSKNNKDD